MPVKVFAAIPTREEARYPDFYVTLFQQRPPFGTHIALGNCKGTYIYEQQNFMVLAFLQSDADYFWLLNDDTRLPPTTLSQLLSHDVDVVAPLCLYKTPPFKPILYDTDSEEFDDLHHRYLLPTDKGLVPVVASGSARGTADPARLAA